MKLESETAVSRNAAKRTLARAFVLAIVTGATGCAASNSGSIANGKTSSATVLTSAWTTAPSDAADDASSKPPRVGKVQRSADIDRKSGESAEPARPQSPTRRSGAFGTWK
jgi:hypothetical protein